MTPLIVRALFDSIMILDSGTCPDDQVCDPETWPFDRDHLTYACNPETVRDGNKVYQSVIGGFAPGVGVHVDYGYDRGASVGVVPGFSTEVPRH